MNRLRYAGSKGVATDGNGKAASTGNDDESKINMKKIDVNKRNENVDALVMRLARDVHPMESDAPGAMTGERARYV